jgi:aryl-alcohol dehydrogenase-like predicted oxidoreductase
MSTSTILRAASTSSVRHLEENCAAANVELTDEQMQSLSAAV